MTRIRIRRVGPPVGLIRQNAIQSERKQIAKWICEWDEDGVFKHIAEAIEQGKHWA